MYLSKSRYPILDNGSCFIGIGGQEKWESVVGYDRETFDAAQKECINYSLFIHISLS